MTQLLRARSAVAAFSLLCATALLFAPSAGAAAKRHAAAPDIDLEFRTLAQQRPWICPDQQGSAVPATKWRGGQAECAWQNRLRMRSWRGTGGLCQGACVSSQAQWWVWARAASAAAPGASAAWRSEWDSHSLIDEHGPEKRIVIVRRLPDGEWSATEWRWSPSPRPATRRWQEGRWQLLAARARQLRAPAEPQQKQAETRMLQSVLDASLANRVGEIGNGTWRWKADGYCLNVDAVGLGQQIMQLPYAVDDSRLEQRAAMQLQLARRYPKAVWLTDFSLVPAAARARGGAKFYAIWLEQSTLKGQLWIPTRGDGPLVRLRITTAVAAAPGGQADPQALARAEQLMQRELAALASRWAANHE